jgi:hypothetical protein
MRCYQHHTTPNHHHGETMTMAMSESSQPPAGRNPPPALPPIPGKWIPATAPQAPVHVEVWPVEDDQRVAIDVEDRGALLLQVNEALDICLRLIGSVSRLRRTPEPPTTT